MISDVLYQFTVLLIQIALVCAALFYILSSVARRISGYSDSPLVLTPHDALPKIAESLRIVSRSKVYELGCGDGRFLFYCARQFPEARFIGIEKNPLLIMYLNMKQRMTGVKNITFKRENIFECDISTATHIYVFLLPPAMKILFSGNKTLPGVRLASRAYPILDRTPEQVVELANYAGTWNENRLYIYTL